MDSNSPEDKHNLAVYTTSDLGAPMDTKVGLVHGQKEQPTCDGKYASISYVMYA